MVNVRPASPKGRREHSADLTRASNQFLGILSLVGFLVIFPGFFVYHFSVAAGIIPSFAAGLYGPATLLVAGAALVPMLSILPRTLRAKIPTMFLCFIVYFAAWVFINGYIFPFNAFATLANKQMLSTIIAFFALFTVGLFFKMDSVPFRRAIALLWFVLIAITISQYNKQDLMLNVAAKYGASEGVASYQGFSRSFLFTALVLYAIQKRQLYRWSVVAASAVVLFFLGARSEFSGFVIVITLIEAIDARMSVRRAVLYIGIAIVAVFTSTVFEDQLMASRQSELLSISESSSWAARGTLTQFALKQIGDDPLAGRYGGHFLTGSKGGYAHNALSAWVSLGVVGFALYVSLTVTSAYRTTLGFLRNPNSELTRLAAAVSMLSVVLSALAVPIFWSAIAFAWGLAARLELLSILRPEQPKTAGRARR